MTTVPDLKAVEAMDAIDPLSGIRDRFTLPEGFI